nr:hypothetical protein [Tanacetum cinerariifolium]
MSGQGRGRGCGSYGGGGRGQGHAPSQPHSLGRGNDHQHCPSTMHAPVQHLCSTVPFSRCHLVMAWAVERVHNQLLRDLVSLCSNKHLCNTVPLSPCHPVMAWAVDGVYAHLLKVVVSELVASMLPILLCWENGGGVFTQKTTPCGKTSSFQFMEDMEVLTYGEVLQIEGGMKLSLGVLGECLCGLCYYYESHADLWVMKVYGVKDSWTKSASFPYLTHPWISKYLVPLFISNDGNVLIKYAYPMELVIYKSKDSSFEYFDTCCEACVVVESLVSPFLPLALADNNEY